MQESSICARDRHLFDAGPKRILALDGGGVRGAVSIAFLERLEELLADLAGAPVRLCDWFDLIGGTSTGAIIAAGLCFGMSAKEIREFYVSLAPRIFRTSFWRVPGLRARFDAGALLDELGAVFGDVRLGSDALQTGLGIVMKRIDSGSCWILLNNCRSAFWETPADGSFVGNRHFRLANLIRASAAAPHYFDPELIQIVEGSPPGLFLDGAMTPHNNPSLAMFLSAVLPSYGLNWPTGAGKLRILSVGTGSHRARLGIEEARRIRPIGLALKALASQISENEKLVLLLMSWLGQTSSAWRLDSEVGDVGAVNPPFGKLFGFERLDILLEQAWLAEHLGAEVDPRKLERLRRIDDPAMIGELYDLGRRAAAHQLTREGVAHWVREGEPAAVA